MNTSDMARPRSGERDHVDNFLEEISADLPSDLDLTVEGIVDRIGGINRRIKWMHEETLDQLDLTMSDWHVLTSLRWAGEPYRRKAGELARRADLTTGAMTSRLDALEKEGLVRRLRDPEDRRSVLVELTEKGREKHEQGLGNASKSWTTTRSRSPTMRIWSGCGKSRTHAPPSRNARTRKAT